MACRKCMDFWTALFVVAAVMLIVASLYNPPDDEGN